MRRLFESFGKQVMLSAVLSIVLGLTFIIWPLKITSMICRVLALMLLFVGGGRLVRYIRKEGGGFTLGAGIVEVLVGIWIFAKPQSIQELIPIIIGILLLVHGIQDATMSWQVKEHGGTNWVPGFVFAVLNILFALVMICNAIGVVKIGMIFIGCVLVYDGVSDLFITWRVKDSLKDLAMDLTAVDTEWKEKE